MLPPDHVSSLTVAQQSILEFNVLHLLLAYANRIFTKLVCDLREFVNNVWYIKILSPFEVHQMGKEEGLDIPNNLPAANQRLPNGGSSCEVHVSQKETRNMNGIPLGSLDY